MNTLGTLSNRRTWSCISSRYTAVKASRRQLQLLLAWLSLTSDDNGFSVCLFFSVCLCFSVCLFSFVCFSRSARSSLSVCFSMSVCFSLSVCLFFSVCLSVFLCLSVCFSLSVCLFFSVYLCFSVFQMKGVSLVSPGCGRPNLRGFQKGFQALISRDCNWEGSSEDDDDDARG